MRILSSPFKHLLATLSILALASVRGQGGELVIRIPGGEAETDARAAYFDELLTLALEKTRERYGAYRVEKSGLKMLVHGRAVELLKQDKRLDLLYFMTSIQHEEELLPIRIPLLKGLLGYRIFLIREEDAALFAAIDSPEALARLTAGQGHRWPDVDILSANGFPVEVGRSYEGLFEMLKRKRFDYFPRGITEIWPELEQRPHEGLAIERNLMLVYPTALYFFVHPENTELARRIEDGLRLALADGSFDRVFMRHNAAMIERSQLETRRVFHLPNPILPRETPLGESDLWYRASE